MRRLLLACGIALAVGCGSSPPLLRGAITVDSNVNPDRAGRPSPIVVRIYELKATAAFSGADFFALFDNEQATLSGELVGREEFELQPAAPARDEIRRRRRRVPGSRAGALAPGRAGAAEEEPDDHDRSAGPSRQRDGEVSRP